MDGLRQELNLEPPAALSEVKQLIELLDPEVRHFRVRTVAGRIKGEWTNVMTIFDACDIRGAERTPRRYAEFIFLEEALDEPRLFDVLRDAMEGSIVLSDCTARFDPRPRWRRVYRHSQSGLSSHPGTLFTIEPKERPHSFDGSLNDPLLSYEQLYASRGWDAVERWTGIRLARMSSWVDVGAVVLFLPERRAWLERVERVEDYLRISVGGRAEQTDNLVLRGAFTADVRTSDAREVPFGVHVREGLAEIEIPDRWETLEVYLIGPGDEVFDYHTQGPGGSEGHPPIAATDRESGLDESTVVAKVRQGEGAQLEFKEFVDPASNKGTEISRTAIAFANTEGGEIMIGVQNDGTIVGVDAAVRRWAPRPAPNLRDCIERYRGSVLALLNDNLDPTLPIDVFPLDLRGRTVLVIRVPSGSARPYMDVHTKRVHVRRGSNNMPADRNDLLKLCHDDPFRPVGDDPSWSGIAR